MPSPRGGSRGRLVTLMHTLLLGMGNPILTDDAVGVRLTAILKARLAERPGLTVIDECAIGGLEILEVIQGYDRLIVIDSIKSGSMPPGHWCRFDATALRETMNLNNVHDTNFATALELGRKLGMRVADDRAIHIFAIEIQENTTFSEELTPAVAAAFSELVDEIGREVERLLG
jgi:hydrogenase maturation protease